MDLKLSVKGNTDSLLYYLKNFENVCTSILFEVDGKEKKIVAKALNPEHTSVRYSAISFEEANISLVDGTAVPEGRIKFGVMNQLGNFIKIVSAFNDELAKMEGDDKSFTLTFNYIDVLTKEDKHVLECKTVVFVSPSLKASFDGFLVKEFIHVPDEYFFNNIFRLENTIDFEFTSNTCAEINKLHSIYNNSNLVFCAKGNEVVVTDNADGNARKFVKKLAVVDGANVNDLITITVKFDTFNQLFGKGKETYKMILGENPNARNGFKFDRLNFESLDSDTRVSISAITNATN